MKTTKDKEKEEEELETVLTSDMGELIVLQRTLHTMESTKEEIQREHIFHSRYTIQDKVYSLIIDEGSCTNVAFTHLVDKLSLPTVKHPQSYSLQWLKKGNEVPITKQPLVTYSIGNLRDEVLCDVLPMDIYHLLLGRPW